MAAGKRERLSHMSLALITWMLYSSSGSLAVKDCSTELPKLGPCLGWVTNQVPIPPEECCTSLSSLVNDAPECLCQVIDPNGPAAGQLPGLNMTRVLQTPEMCKIAFSPANCAAGGEVVVAPPTTAPSASGRIVGVPKFLFLLPATAAAALFGLWLQ